MICISIQNKTYGEILEILADPKVEMAEIRLDRCPLSDEEIADLFGNSDTPLIATCRISEVASPAESERLLRLAAQSGARFADLEIEAPAPLSKPSRNSATTPARRSSVPTTISTAPLRRRSCTRPSRAASATVRTSPR